ncbi:MAG TPA: TadE/TadG family type IV pilus assembly protein [Bradyrhizobium sp.]|uniref:TadE/TadG family type IV pilus assembly protein n=1 Tax=Bradyrhizobium sp. TaxID=376 RepID=UPI002B657DAC|nr:TadE/TadG family type IV pilus assembly protein [Bradyrhizobium sp.]HLZ04276.1 TadE/TadG family type IV pilus assembly protein [Bradyrhizobium sp.]
MSLLVSFARLLRRFRRNRSGASALEFAIVAPVFLVLLFAILETALMFFASQVLETITQDAARMILTGQAQNANYTQQNFHDYVCSQIPALFNCNNIAVDVESYSQFSQITFSNQIDGNGNFTTNGLGYNPGGAGCTVVVRVFYPWQLFVTGLGYNIANMANDQRLLIASAAFKNEPFMAGTPCS